MSSLLQGRSHLPAWNRTGLCRISGNDVRTVAKDQSLTTGTTGAEKSVETFSRLKEKMIQLEKNIVFLSQQHHDTLQQLHKEIEQLKNVNRELNFKLMMCHCGDQGCNVQEQTVKTEHANSVAVSDDHLHSNYTVEDVQKLRNSLAAERTKSKCLLRLMERKVLGRQKSPSVDMYDEDEDTADPDKQLYQLNKEAGTQKLPIIKKYETVIQHLQRKNSQQAHELLQIKTDLRDVLYSHKWTPDAFLIARAYVNEEEENDNAGFLPQVAPLGNRQTLEKAYRKVKEEVTLPALKPKISNTVAERHRRAQAIRLRTTRALF